jgi:YYY domain-containing protein
MEYGLVALWWLTYVGLALFGLPVAARLFASLPGRGAGFSFALSLAVMTLVAFWVGFLALGWVALFAGLAALAGCAVLAARSGIDIDRRATVEAVAVFTLVYGFVIALRSVEPGITPGGEKFLDFGMVASLYRAASLPLEDFWFAGESVIYYYGGHFVVALLARLTDTVPWTAFNLGMAGFYGALAAGAYELAGAIAVGRHDRRAVRSYSDHTRRIAGATAVFFTVFASNPSTAIRLLIRRLPTAVRDAAARAFAAAHSQLPDYQVLRPIPEDYQYKVAGRIIPETYNPFPLFGAVRGDIRPYFTSTPFLLCAVGLCYAYYRTPTESVRRRHALVFGAVPVISGFMALVNTWSLAIVLGMTWLTLTFAPTSLRSLVPARLAARIERIVGRPATDTPRGALARTAGAAGLAGVVGVLAVIVALPFFLGPVQAGPGTSLMILDAAARSSVGSLLLVHGAFLAVFLTLLLARGRRRWSSPIVVAGGLAFVALVAFAPAALAPLALFIVPLAAGWYFLATDRIGFVGVLVVAGFGLLVLPELGYLAEGGNGRFNTVVKTYMPTWILWASAAGVVLPRLVRGRSAWAWTRRQQLGSVLAVVLVLSTAAFGGVAVQRHFADPNVEEPTLDGLAAAEENVPGQVAAIRWLDNRSGRPTIVSAPGRYVYRWSASPAASLTGVPTVAGVSHEAQYRGRQTYLNRVYEVNTIYLGSAERRAALLDKYNVEYIYVGPTERERYGEVRPFSELRGVRVAFREDNVTIYEVDQGQLRASEDEGR